MLDLSANDDVNQVGDLDGGVIFANDKNNTPVALVEQPRQVKKRRGRPPKSATIQSFPKRTPQPVHDSSKTTTPKRRGRPPKATPQGYTVQVNNSGHVTGTILDLIKPKRRRGRPKGGHHKTLAEKGYKKDAPSQKRKDPATQYILDTFYPSTFNGSSMSKRRCLRSDTADKNDPFELELQQIDVRIENGTTSKSMEF